MTPFDQQRMVDAYKNRVDEIRRLDLKQLFAGACCFRDFSLFHAAAAGGAADVFRYLLVDAGGKAPRFSEKKASRLRFPYEFQSVETMALHGLGENIWWVDAFPASETGRAEILKILRQGAVYVAMPWEMQRLVWIGYCQQNGCLLHKLPKDLVRLIIKQCSTRIPVFEDGEPGQIPSV